MRICDSYKCKRLALWMTQKEFGELIGVGGGTISRFENGEELSTAVFNSIRYGVEDYIKGFSRDKYIETRILENALALQYLNDQEKLLVLNHMLIHIGKLNMDILKGETQEEI